MNVNELENYIKENLVSNYTRSTLKQRFSCFMVDNNFSLLKYNENKQILEMFNSLQNESSIKNKMWKCFLNNQTT